MSLTKVSFSMIQGAPLNILDFGADNTGTTDITAALNAAIAVIAARTNQGGTIYFPAGFYRLNTAINITATHGLRLLGDAPAFAPGFEGSPTRIYFYGSGDAFTLTGAIAAQSSFIFENIHLENKGFPGTNNGIKVSNAAFSGGISLIGSAITYFSSGIQANQSQPFGYLYVKNSAIYFNSTWGIAFNGNIVNIEDTTISNNGPLWTTANNTFDANPVGGGLLIEFASTSVTIGQGCDFEGMTVGIFIRGAYGASIQGGYFESIAKCSIQATNCVGLQINGNYVNPNTESATILLDNCFAVKVNANGYSPNVYVTGLVDYDLTGCNVIYISTDLNRTISSAQMVMKDRYGTQNVDINDVVVAYQATPSGGNLVNISGPTLQTEVGPFYAPINRYVATAAGFFYTGTVTAVNGQYVYFSVLIRNMTEFSAVVRDTSDANTIVSKSSILNYDKEWSVLTVGGKVSVNQTYRLIVVSIKAETFDLGGVVSYLGATPLAKQVFSFANYRSTINQNQSPVTVTTTPYTVLTNGGGIIANIAGTTTLSLPSAVTYPGRQLSVRTIQAQSVISDASNVVPLIGGAAGTAILSATAGKWAMLQSDGTSWQIMSSN